MNPTSQLTSPGPRRTTRPPQPSATARHPESPSRQPRGSRATHRVATRSTVGTSAPAPFVETPSIVAGTAVVKLELQPRTDAELISFAESHVAAMEGNPWFPSPMPSMDDFDDRVAAFESSLIEVEQARLLLLNLTQRKDQHRRELEAAFNQRSTYIQLASQGNPDVIATTALATRRPRTRTGTLPSPQSLALSVTQTSGQLLVTWDTVRGARSFQLECALITEGEPPQWTTLYIGGQLRHLATDLTPGQRYAFRLATIGGQEGRSPWSPVVERMVA